MSAFARHARHVFGENPVTAGALALFVALVLLAAAGARTGSAPTRWGATS